MGTTSGYTMLRLLCMVRYSGSYRNARTAAMRASWLAIMADAGWNAPPSRRSDPTYTMMNSLESEGTSRVSR
jgi:hypothetical protein